MKKNLWLLIFLQGIVAVLIGLVSILWPVKTLETLIWFMGGFLLLESILLVIAAFWPGDKNGTSGILIFEGIIGLVFALLIMSWPNITLEVIFLGFALWSLASGILGIVKVIFSKHPHHVNDSNLFTSLLKVLLSIILLSFPQASLSLIVILFGFFILALGLGDMIYSLKHKALTD